MRVAILGTGAIGLGAAAFLADAGHHPVLWSPSGNGATELASGEPLTVSGALTGSHRVDVAPSCQEAIAGADVVLLALPGNGHRAVMDAAAPHISPEQIVVISGHLSFGALYLSRALAARGVAPPIVAWGTTVTTGRRTGRTGVNITNIRSKLDAAVLPISEQDRGIAACTALFGDRFVPRRDLIAIALSNLNPQNHLAIALCNFTRIERGEAWPQYSNMTPAMGRLMEALDAERLAIADAFGVTVRTVREHLHYTYDVPQGPVGEMTRVMAERGDALTGPRAIDTRYITEDAPFGLFATAQLGRLAARPATLHESGLALFSALCGRDFAAENDLLPAIGFADLTASRLQRLVQHGWPP